MKDAKLHSAGVGECPVGDFANTGPNKDEDECVCHPHHIHGACGSKSAPPIHLQRP